MAGSSGVSGWFLSGFFTRVGMSKASPQNTISTMLCHALLSNGATYVFVWPSTSFQSAAGTVTEPSTMTCSSL